MASRRGPIVTALVLAGMALGAPSAQAAGLQISPAKIDAEVNRGDRLPPVRVLNGTRREVTIRVAALRAGQELSGLPRFDDDARARREGRAFLAVSPDRFTLAPGASRDVSLRVTGGPVRGRGAYGVVLVDGRMTDRGDGPVVTPRVRLAANVLLAYPGRGRAAGAITDLRAGQSGRRQIDFITRIENRGRIHATPSLRLTIRDARGRIVHRQPVLSGNVLPGYERELPATLRKVLDAGRYTARVDARLGRDRTSRTLRFTLVGPNELPTPDLQIADLPVPRPEAGEPFTVRVAVRNDGTAPVSARGVIAVGPPGGEPAARHSLEARELAPGAEATLEQTAEPVAAGTHELTVRFTDGDRVLAERAVTFTTAEAVPWTDRLLDWLVDHLLLVLVAAVLLVVAVAAFAALKIRRLQRRLREQSAGP